MPEAASARAATSRATPRFPSAAQSASSISPEDIAHESIPKVQRLTEKPVELRDPDAILRCQVSAQGSLNTDHARRLFVFGIYGATALGL